MIQHLGNSEIDRSWWDAQLLRCPHRLWYAQSWVLDLVSPGWEALVDRGSGAIMPLTWRRKYGIDYLCMPYAIQQLGVFAPAMDHHIGQAMLHAVPNRFRYWDISLNGAMPSMTVADARTTEQVDQVMDMRPGIDVVRNGYAEGHRRNLRKARAAGMDQRPVQVDAFVDLFLRTTGKRFGNVPGDARERLTALIHQALERGQCRLPGAWRGGELLAALCSVTWEGRVIILKAATTEEGQMHRAMFLLVDAEIEHSVPRASVFDFAGSNNPGVARFYAGFGAQPSVYLRLVRNRLPPPLRWLKR